MQFKGFNKIPRLSRNMTITEKIDGTNGLICIFSQSYLDNYIQTGCPNGVCSSDYADRKYQIQAFIDNFCLYKNNDVYLFAGSKSRWLDTFSNGDNFGFAKWVKENSEELLKLGEGQHFGEWMGQGIQRNYGLKEKRFYLFNVKKWNDAGIRPKCCDVVPVIYEGLFDTQEVERQLELLKEHGSYAINGFMNPEGLIIYHQASGQLFKKTVENDDTYKGN